jgi:hypothetical protein
MGTIPVDLDAGAQSVEAEPQRDRIARQCHLDSFLRQSFRLAIQ